MKKIYLSTCFAVAISSLFSFFTTQAQITAINSVDDLVSFRDAVNTGTTYNGMTVTLETDIDLGGGELDTHRQHNQRGRKRISGHIRRERTYCEQFFRKHYSRQRSSRL